MKGGLQGQGCPVRRFTWVKNRIRVYFLAIGVYLNGNPRGDPGGDPGVIRGDPGVILVHFRGIRVFRP